MSFKHKTNVDLKLTGEMSTNGTDRFMLLIAIAVIIFVIAIAINLIR